MLTLIVVGALSAAPVKLASPGLTGVQLNKEEAVFYSDHLAQQLALKGVSVMTATEINSLLGLERQKQLLGCSSESTSCMAELADALGVDGLVTGSIGKLGSQFQIDVKVVASNDGHKLASFSRFLKNERDVLETLTEAAGVLSQQLREKLRRTDVAEVSLSTGGARRMWWLPTVIGGVAVVTGAVLMGLVSGHASALRSTMNPPLTYDQARSAVSVGSTEQIIAITAFAVGGAALLAAGGVYLFGGPVSAAPVVSGSGGGVVLQGALP